MVTWVSLCWFVVSLACVFVLIPCGAWCAHIVSFVSFSLFDDRDRSSSDAKAKGIHVGPCGRTSFWQKRSSLMVERSGAAASVLKLTC